MKDQGTPSNKDHPTPEGLDELVAELRRCSGNANPNGTGISSLLSRAADALERLRPRALTEGEDHQASHDALHDLVMLRAEEFAIGGGPGFRERQAKAWRAAEEIFEP